MREILRVHSSGSLKDEVLRNRAKQAHNPRSQEFVMVIDGEEAGLMSYEDWSHQSVGFIYEIFVLPKFRRQGIGASLLSYGEELAVRLGCTHIRLQVRAFDKTIEPEKLFSWYENTGYVEESGGSEYMSKIITPKMA